MKKIAFIVQRYGEEVSGGAEYHCRVLAERLSSTYNVTVITNCALNHEDWENYFQPGRELVNGVEVIRFSNLSKKRQREFDRCTRKLRKKRYKAKGLREAFYKVLGMIDGKSLSRVRRKWFQAQGPHCPGLISYLKENHKQYDKLIFFTYLFYPTAMGIDVAPEKSLLIPTAHDEPEIYLPIFQNVFTKPAHILYNSHGEKAFVERLFRNSHIPNQVVGIGVEKPRGFAAKESISEVDFNNTYFVYIGRIESGKGLDELIRQFILYKEQFLSDAKFILVGKGSLEIPVHPDIIKLGFVSEEVKSTVLANASGLLIASRFESLSMVTLESMALGVPVVTFGACEVLRDHVKISQAGLVYNTQEEFSQALEYLRNQPLETMRQNGKTYVEQNYSWKEVLKKINTAINQPNQS